MQQASLVIREMQNKTAMRYHFTPARMAIINRSENNKCRRGGRKIRALIHCRWKYEVVQPLWKTFWYFLNNLNIELPYEPVIPLLGIYPKILKICSHRNLCINVQDIIHISQRVETTNLMNG